MSQEWCEHTNWHNMTATEVSNYCDSRNWNFCPICGTPRPKEKSKRERLADKFKFHLSQMYVPYYTDSTIAEELSEIAVNFLETEGE